MQSIKKGEIDLVQLKSAGFEWMRVGVPQEGLFSPGSIDAIRQAFSRPGTEALVFLGTWCPDTQEQLPLFLTLMERATVPQERIRLFSLDRDKVLLPWTDQYRVQKVPTFIFVREGQELGRIIETPEVNLATHSAAILGDSIQERYSPRSACFGCGPANPHGLRIRSFASRQNPDEIVADWMAAPHHEAFPGMLNGGIVGALLDCHSNWTAAYHLMKKAGQDHPPCTVTADYAIQLKRPTPTSGQIHLSAHVVQSGEDRATVEATLTAGGKVCATCKGTFVAVKPGHPAYHRW